MNTSNDIYFALSYATERDLKSKKVQSILKELQQLIVWLVVIFVFVNFILIFQLKLMAAEPTKPKISLIIDDVGNNHLLDLRALNLPKEVSLSVLPNTQFSLELAEKAHQKGMDILLHQPMESVDKINLLGPGALFADMDRQQFTQVLTNNLKMVPFVVGLNNHMGSRLTADHQKMNWLMAVLKKKSLFFIDSRTTTQTVAQSTAQEWQIPNMRRKVFLDHVDEPDAIAREFSRLINLAEKKGFAVAIGHPRKNTMDFLEQKLSMLNGAEFELVSISSLMNSQRSHIRPLKFLSTPAHFYDDCYKNIGSEAKYRSLAMASSKAVKWQNGCAE